MVPTLGAEVSSAGIARYYGGLIDGFVGPWYAEWIGRVGALVMGAGMFFVIFSMSFFTGTQVGLEGFKGLQLIGAEAFHIFVLSDKTGQLELEASEGQEAPVKAVAVGEGPVGTSAKTGENHFASQVAHREATPFEKPIAVIAARLPGS